MWTDPNGTTPSIVQVDFGPWGQYMPGDGEAYCGPTSMVMGLYYLYANGFTQLAPGPFVSQDDPQTVNLERIIAGLCHTSILGGTFVDGLQHGVAHYLSACGISPSQYAYSSIGNPNLSWLAQQLTPNVAENPTTIVLANFAVGWYSGTPPTLSNNGGHVLAPLTVDLGGGTIIINNAYPASFESVPNEPLKNPQKVQITAARQTGRCRIFRCRRRTTARSSVRRKEAGRHTPFYGPVRPGRSPGQTKDDAGFFLTYTTDSFAPAQAVLSTSVGINASPSKRPIRSSGRKRLIPDRPSVSPLSKSMASRSRAAAGRRCRSAPNPQAQSAD
jgi:hypothetical protein